MYDSPEPIFLTFAESAEDSWTSTEASTSQSTVTYQGTYTWSTSGAFSSAGNVHGNGNTAYGGLTNAATDNYVTSESGTFGYRDTETYDGSNTSLTT